MNSIGTYTCRGNLIVKRQSLLPRVLSATGTGTDGGAGACRKPFKPPSSNHSYTNYHELTRRLSARKRFVPWGSSTCTPRPPLLDLDLNANSNAHASHVDLAEQPHDKIELPLPPGIDPLVLWHPPHSEHGHQASNFTTIAVDPLLVRFLRPHQRCFFLCSLILHFDFLPLLHLELDTSSSMYFIA